MDLPVTPTIQIMSTEKKDKYKNLYSKYVDHSVNLHNYHLTFVRFMGYDTGLAIRKNVRSMIKLLKEMQRTCREAYYENKQNLKDQKKAEKQAEIDYKKANPKKAGRPKGTKNGNNQTTNAKSL